MGVQYTGIFASLSDIESEVCGIFIWPPHGVGAKLKVSQSHAF